MYDLLVKLMFLAAVGQLGLSFFDLEQCQTRKCTQNIEKKARDVLAVDWKPISLFPEEARRFR